MAVVQLPNTYIYRLSAESVSKSTATEAEAVHRHSAQGQEDQASRPHHKAGGNFTRSKETTLIETLEPVAEDSQTQEIEKIQVEKEIIFNLRDHQYLSRDSSLSDQQEESRPLHHEAGGDSSRRSRFLHRESRKGNDKGKRTGTLSNTSTSSDRSEQPSNLFL